MSRTIKNFNISQIFPDQNNAADAEQERLKEGIQYFKENDHPGTMLTEVL